MDCPASHGADYRKVSRFRYIYIYYVYHNISTIVSHKSNRYQHSPAELNQLSWPAGGTTLYVVASWPDEPRIAWLWRATLCLPGHFRRWFLHGSTPRIPPKMRSSSRLCPWGRAQLRTMYASELWVPPFQYLGLSIWSAMLVLEGATHIVASRLWLVWKFERIPLHSFQRLVYGAVLTKQQPVPYRVVRKEPKHSPWIDPLLHPPGIWRLWGWCHHLLCG